MSLASLDAVHPQLLDDPRAVPQGEGRRTTSAPPPQDQSRTANFVLASVRLVNRLTGHLLSVGRPRRMQVSETVSLGEKRFVSIVTVDGVDYLIGGGSTNLALLARLDAPAAGQAQQVSAEFGASLDQAWRKTGDA